MPSHDFYPSLDTYDPRFASTPGWWLEGVPDSWRSAILTYLPDCFMPVVELVNHAAQVGAIRLTCFYISELQQANVRLGYDIPDSTLIKVIATPDNPFFSKMEMDSRENIVSKSEKKSFRGRPAESYRARSLSEVRDLLLIWAAPRIVEKAHPAEGAQAALVLFSAPMMDDTVETDESPYELSRDLMEATHLAFYSQEKSRRNGAERSRRTQDELDESLDDPYSTRLSDNWPKFSASKYRATYLHGYVEANPDIQIGRWALVKKFGISDSSLDDLVKRAGVEREQQSILVAITRPENIRGQVKNLKQQVHGYPISVAVRYGDQEQHYVYNQDDSKRIETDLRGGAQIEICFQQANRYHVVSDMPPIRESVSDNTTASSENPSCAERDVNSSESVQPHYVPTYDPRWVAAQLRLALRLLGWVLEGGDLVNPETGKKSHSAPAQPHWLKPAWVAPSVFEPNISWKRNSPLSYSPNS